MEELPKWAAEALNISYIIFLLDNPCGSIFQTNWEEAGVTTPPKPGSHRTFLHSIFCLFSCEFSCLHLKFCNLKQDHLLTFYIPFYILQCMVHTRRTPLSFRSYAVSLSLGIVFEISRFVPVLRTKISPSERWSIPSLRTSPQSSCCSRLSPARHDGWFENRLPLVTFKAQLSWSWDPSFLACRESPEVRFAPEPLLQSQAPSQHPSGRFCSL